MRRGTPAFRPPEMDGPLPVVSMSADVFCLGSMVYELLLLRPFPDKTSVEVRMMQCHGMQ